MWLSPEQWFVETNYLRFRDGGNIPRTIYYKRETYLLTLPLVAEDVVLE